MTKQLRFVLGWLVLCACEARVEAADIEWL
jgi:hypothetical protein